MTSILDFFLMEARESLDGMARVLDAADEARVDADELHRLARALRGSAQLARQDRIREVAATLETDARALVQGRQQWNDRVRKKARDAVQELRSLVDQVEAEGAQPIETEPGGPVIVEEGAGVEPGTPQTEPKETTLSDDRGDISTLVQQAEQLASDLAMLPDPGDRMEELVDLLTRVRDGASAGGLAEAAALVERSLARLRIGGTAAVLALMPRLRAVIREGGAEAPAAAEPAGAPESADAGGEPGPPEPQPAASPEPAGAGSDARPEPDPGRAAESAEASTAGDVAAETEEAVPIEALCYRGAAALERALELRTELESVPELSPEARATFEEVFDLIRLGMK